MIDILNFLGQSKGMLLSKVLDSRANKIDYVNLTAWVMNGCQNVPYKPTDEATQTSAAGTLRLALTRLQCRRFLETLEVERPRQSWDYLNFEALNREM